MSLVSCAKIGYDRCRYLLAMWLHKYYQIRSNQAVYASNKIYSYSIDVL